MAITISIPSENSIFRLGVPVTFRGKADSGVVRVDLFAEQFFLGSDGVEAETWVITYPRFNRPGKRQIRVIGFDSSGNRIDSVEVDILLTNTSSSGFEPGIDVSDFDDFVNWQQVRSAGFSFAFAKATEGGTFKADTFPGNWRRMQGAGVIRGAYHFFRPLVDPKTQARNFLDYIASVEPIQPDDLPPALDLEHFPESVGRQWSSISKADRIKRVREWIDIVEDEIKRKPIIYTSFGFWDGFMSGVKDFSNYPLWVAHYTNKAKPLIPPEWSSWTFWQYTDSTEVPGIPTPDEDGDRFNGSLSELLAFISSTKLS
jgi:GH25 family lysozyme M1 (1,4-beta-N-acetylmuramidase)